jgi:hypothetical protein
VDEASLGGQSCFLWVGDVVPVPDDFCNHWPLMVAILLRGLALGFVAQLKEIGCWKMTIPRSVVHAQ